MDLFHQIKGTFASFIVAELMADFFHLDADVTFLRLQTFSIVRASRSVGWELPPPTIMKSLPGGPKDVTLAYSNLYLTSRETSCPSYLLISNPFSGDNPTAWLPSTLDGFSD